MPGTRTRPARRAPRAFGLALVGAPFLLVAFVACDGGAPGDADGGAGNGSDAGGEGTGAASSGGAGSGGGPGGGNGSGAASNVEPIELEEYCQSSAERYFDYLSACYGSQHFPEASREEYVASTAARCMNAESAIEAGRLDYDATRAAECVAALEEVDCVADPACDGVFEGRSEPGEDCYPEETLIFLVGVSTCQNGQCAGEQCPGSCEALPATGEACTGWCQAGDYCDEDERCAPLPAIGEPCDNERCADGAACSDDLCHELATSSADTCDEDVLCAGPTVCDEGTCRSQVELGGPCSLPVHCQSPLVCREEICQLPGEEGAACTTDSHCAEGFYCHWWEDASECAAFVPLGEVCGGVDRTKCALGQACILGIEDTEARCREQVPAGESCEDGYELCEDGVYCDVDSVCAPPGTVGDSCWTLHPCAEGLGCHCTAEDTEECMGSQQDDGDTCQPLLAGGEPCFTFQECQSGECDLTGSGATDEPGECVATQATDCLP